MHNKLRPFIHLIIVFTIFLAIKTLVSYTALSSFSIMLIDAEFDHDDVVDIYFGSTEKAGFRENYNKRSDSFTAGVRSTVIV